MSGNVGKFRGFKKEKFQEVIEIIDLDAMKICEFPQNLKHLSYLQF